MRIPHRHLSPLAFLLAATATPLAAQQSSDAQDSIVVAEGKGSGNSGRVAANIAAGTHNQQLGAAVVAVADLPITVQSAEQRMFGQDDTDRATHIAIGAGAFSNNSGMVSLNLTAGTQNQSANLAALAVGNSGVVSDQMLAQASAPTKPAGSPAQGLEATNDSIAIDDSAFGGNSGLVQLNVVGGERNSSANTFALNVSAGGEP